MINLVIIQCKDIWSIIAKFAFKKKDNDNCDGTCRTVAADRNEMILQYIIIRIIQETKLF